MFSETRLNGEEVISMEGGAVRSPPPPSARLSRQHVTVPCEEGHLDVDEGGEVELVSGPLTQEELVTLLLRQSVEELTRRRERPV